MSGHECGRPNHDNTSKPCRYSWNDRWCAKTISCPSCGEEVRTYLECRGNQNKCTYYKPKRFIDNFILYYLSAPREYLEWYRGEWEERIREDAEYLARLRRISSYFKDDEN